MSRSIHVGIVTNCPDRQAEWTGWLRADRFVVNLDVAAVTSETSDISESQMQRKLDIVVSDRPLQDLPEHLKQSIDEAGSVGLILIDAEGTADVSLPKDVRGRELRLAALLLAEVVRLRRQRSRDRRVQNVLTQLATSDPLTGLPNRRAWDDELKTRLTNSSLDDQRLVVALFDVDCFKQVNDQHGHLMGDRVLKRFAKSLSDSIRGTDYVARLGGDEFGVILSDVNPAGATELVNRIRQDSCEAASAQDSIKITASVGFAACVLGGETDSSRILNLADQALLAAKRSGRDRTMSAV